MITAFDNTWEVDPADVDLYESIAAGRFSQVFR